MTTLSTPRCMCMLCITLFHVLIACCIKPSKIKVTQCQQRYIHKDIQQTIVVNVDTLLIFPNLKVQENERSVA